MEILLLAFLLSVTEFRPGQCSRLEDRRAARPPASFFLGILVLVAHGWPLLPLVSGKALEGPSLLGQSAVVTCLCCDRCLVQSSQDALDVEVLVI